MEGAGGGLSPFCSRGAVVIENLGAIAYLTVRKTRSLRLGNKAHISKLTK